MLFLQLFWPFGSLFLNRENNQKPHNWFYGGFCWFAFFSRSVSNRTGKYLWHLVGKSDNYDIFMKEFQKTGDKLQAAKATIDAGILAKYGFHNINEEGILMEPLSEINGFKIRAYFTRV